MWATHEEASSSPHSSDRMSKDHSGDVSATNSADRKNNGGAGNSSSNNDPNNQALLEAASLFGEFLVDLVGARVDGELIEAFAPSIAAYWGQNPAAAAAAAGGGNALFGNPFAGAGGLGPMLGGGNPGGASGAGAAGGN